MNVDQLLERAAAVLTPMDGACDCEICTTGRDLRRYLDAPHPDAATLRRWYRRDVDLTVPGGAL